MNVLTIPSRFNGPAGVGNGGYVCGRIAAYVAGRPAGDTGHGVARRSRRGRPGCQVLRRSGVSRLLRLRDEPRSRRRAADLSRTGDRPGLVGGAVDAGSFGRRFRLQGAGRGGLGRARLPQRDGRKLTAGSALLGPGGDVLAVAGAVWLTVPRPAQKPAAKAAAAKAAAA